jgi:hypothetical protein
MMATAASRSNSRLRVQSGGGGKELRRGSENEARKCFTLGAATNSDAADTAVQSPDLVGIEA